MSEPSRPPVYESHLSELELIARGKVRDIYALDDAHMLIVTTDRFSAFDVVFNEPIPHKGELLTPSASQGALRGITRGTILDISKDLGIPLREGNLTRYDMWCSDECFLTGSGAEVIPVVKLDGREIGSGKPGPITQRVLASFRQRVRVEGTRI